MQRIIGTFHKTGTVLMQSIVRKAGKRGLLKTWAMRKEDEPADWELAFQPHAHLIVPGLREDSHPMRVAVIVRDPRDIIVSAAHYHTRSSEKFLHYQREEFGGKTYQEALNEAQTFEDKLLFEIDNYSGTTIERMLSFPYERPDVMRFHFEDLVTDTTLAPFRRIFEFLEIEPKVAKRMLRIAERNSLFSGKVDRPKHVRSGKAAQWRNEFSPKVASAFAAKFPTAVVDLGYPEDGWSPGEN